MPYPVPYAAAARRQDADVDAGQPGTTEIDIVVTGSPTGSPRRPASFGARLSLTDAGYGRGRSADPCADVGHVELAGLVLAERRDVPARLEQRPPSRRRRC